MAVYKTTLTALLVCVGLLLYSSTAQDLTLETLETRLISLEATVEQLSQAECSCDGQSDDTIAFSVFMADPSVQALDHTIIPFVNVITNVGNGYSFITNVFTVPKDGVYVFFAHLDCTPDYRAFHIVVNGTVVKGTAHNDSDDHSLSTSVILVLRAGDIVDVRHGVDVGHIDGGVESIFTGFRIGDAPDAAAPIIG